MQHQQEGAVVNYYYYCKCTVTSNKQDNPIINIGLCNGPTRKHVQFYAADFVYQNTMYKDKNAELWKDVLFLTSELDHWEYTSKHTDNTVTVEIKTLEL